MEEQKNELEKEEKTFFEKCLAKVVAIKEWLLGFGVIGILIWWIIKILICIFAGICLL